MLILGIDTATLACSAALLGPESLLGEMTVNVKKTHSEQLMPLINSLLEFCQVERDKLTGIAVAAGPGSFTGIRIGVATARGLAQGLSIPAVGVSTLEALAETVTGPGMLICPFLDARREEVYGAFYRRQAAHPYRLEEIMPPGAMKLEALLTRAAEFEQPVTFLGEGLKSYGQEIRRVLAKQALLVPLSLNRAGPVAWRGKQILEETRSTTYEQALPIYIRLPEAERKLKQRSKHHPPGCS